MDTSECTISNRLKLFAHVLSRNTGKRMGKRPLNSNSPQLSMFWLRTTYVYHEPFVIEIVFLIFRPCLFAYVVDLVSLRRN